MTKCLTTRQQLQLLCWCPSLFYSMQVRLQIAMVCMVYTVSHPPPWRVRDGLAQQTISNGVKARMRLLVPCKYLVLTSTCSKYDCPMHELFWANYFTAAAFFSFLYRKCEIMYSTAGSFSILTFLPGSDAVNSHAA